MGTSGQLWRAIPSLINDLFYMVRRVPVLILAVAYADTGTGNRDAVYAKADHWFPRKSYSIGMVAYRRVLLMLILLFFPVFIFLVVTAVFVLALRTIGAKIQVKGKMQLSLDHLLLLVMHPDKVDEKLGDLDQLRARIARKHPRYARFWYCWWGAWIFLSAVFAKLPGKFLLDALKSRVGRE